MHGAVVHRYPNRQGMDIGGLRDRLLHATLDIAGGRLGPRLDRDQVVDDTHAGERADCALRGVSLRRRLDLSVQDDAPVTDLGHDRVGDLRMPTSEMRDLLGDLVVATLVQRGLSDFDVIGDCSDSVDTLGRSQRDVLLVDRHDVAGERDRPVDSGHPDVLLGHLRVVFQLLHDGVPKDLVADQRCRPRLGSRVRSSDRRARLPGAGRARRVRWCGRELRTQGWRPSRKQR